jgi:methionyl-tRNA formyltransferase
VLRRAQPDLVVVVGMGWLLNKSALAVPPLGTINVHPALLPAYRGGEPLFWQLYDGVAESGVTVHFVDTTEDHGPILRQHSFPVRLDASTADFAARMLEVGPAALLEAISGVLAGTIQALPQPEESPTRRARRLRPADRSLIAWDEWSLERTWQVLSRVGPALNWPRTRWRDLGRIPVIHAMESKPPELPAGCEGRDAIGWFLAHPDGKIRFRRRWAPRRWLRAIWRGEAPGHVTIASLMAFGSPAADS